MNGGDLERRVADLLATPYIGEVTPHDAAMYLVDEDFAAGRISQDEIELAAHEYETQVRHLFERAS